MKPRNVLGIGAHFDDVELGCSGTLLKHARQGDNVTVLVVTDSAYNSPDGAVVREAAVARAEGEQAAALMGARLLCLDHKTFEAPFDENLTRTIFNYINTLQIDTIYSHWPGDVHRDHRNVARSAIMAGRHVPRFLLYRSNYYDSDETFTGVFYSDISDVFERKIEVIKSHRSELERVRNQWIEFFTHQNRNDGMKIGCEHAELFGVVRFLF